MTQNRQLKHYTAKPHATRVLFPSGFADIALQEIRFILNSPWLPQKFTPDVTLEKHSILLRNIHLTTALELLMRVTCISDIRWIIAETKTATKSSFEKKCREINWSFFLNPEMSIKIKVDSVASKLFHETALKEILAEVLHDQVKEILTGEDAHLTTTVFVDLNKNKLSISISLAGEPLYKRGYKLLTATAPLREDIAACCLFTMWNYFNVNRDLTKNSETLYDITSVTRPGANEVDFNRLHKNSVEATILIPFSGTGTFVFEYCLHLHNIAPVLFGREYAIQKMPLFKKESFQFLLNQARQQTTLRQLSDIEFECIDNSQKTLDVLQQNAKNFQRLLSENILQQSVQNSESDLSKKFLSKNLHLRFEDFLEMNAPISFPQTVNTVFIPMNPPYGLRLNKISDSASFYKKIAQKINEIALQNSTKTICGFILCPTEQTWSTFYKELTFPRKETYHFNQGGLDIRVCQFIRR